MNLCYLKVFVSDQVDDQVLGLGDELRIVAHRHEVGEHENLNKILWDF